MRNIFVSSTFQDMQAERDVIRRKVFPEINREANLHNDHIEFSDLRWGIDTLAQSEQEASEKILDACLNELYRSDECMVVILGDRYGWIPDSDYFDSLNKRHDISSEMRDQYSATALEIEQGVFAAQKRALVYIREFVGTDHSDLPEMYYEQNDDTRKKLEQLKERLYNNPNCKVCTYPAHFANGKIEESDLDAFAMQLISDLKGVYSKDWEGFDSLSEFDKELEIQWEFIRKRDKEFSARENEKDEIIDDIQSWLSKSLTNASTLRVEDHMQFIIGQSGSGKSTMLAKIASILREKGWDVLPYIGGLTIESSDARRVLRSIVYYIEEQLEIKHQTEFGKESMPEVKVTGDGKVSNSYLIPLAGIMLQNLQSQLVELAEQYAQNHKPLVVVIDALDQFYPDENRDNWAFCPSGLKGNILFIITATPDIRTGNATKTFLGKLSDYEKSLIVTGSLNSRRKELSETVIERILNKPGTEKPLYISMAVDRLMLMDGIDFSIINQSGGTIDDIALRQIDIIDSLPDELDQMAVALFDATGKMIGSSFVQKVLHYFAISRQGLRESDLSYCLGEEWDPVAFSNLLYFLDGQFQLRSDGRIDFLHKALRRGVLSTIDNPANLHWKLEWCLHEQNTEDYVKASELLYHCQCNNDFRYAASIVKPIVFQDFSEDKSILNTTSRRYAKTVADLALSKRGDWIHNWLEAIIGEARSCEANAPEESSSKWNSVWSVLWFLNRFVLKELPQTQAGYETGGAITNYMIEALDAINGGSWSEKDRKTVTEEIHKNNGNYLLSAGHEWKARIERKRIFEESRKQYKSQEWKDYLIWRKMFENCYYLIAVLKGSSDQNVLISALEPAAYGISLLSEKGFLDKYINEQNCLVGMFYGCIGEVCQWLRAYVANLLAYEQDLRYREEVYNRTPNVQTLIHYTGSFHNIAVVYFNLDMEGEENFNDIYSGQEVFFEHTDNPLKLLPIIRFAVGVEKTEGEKFMEDCHEMPPIVASLLSRNKQIELLETAVEMNPDYAWRLSRGHDAIWNQYLRYSYFYFEGLQKWDPRDINQLGYFSNANTEKATERLFKALEYSWDGFADDPARENAFNIIQVYRTIYNYRKFINYDALELSVILDQFIIKSKDFLQLCIENESESYNEETLSDTSELARFMLTKSCMYSAEIILAINHLEQDEVMATHWLDIGASAITELNLWIDDSGKLIRNVKSDGTSPENDVQFEKYIKSWVGDCDELQAWCKEQKLRRNYHQLTIEEKMQYDVSRLMREKGSIRKNDTRDEANSSQIRSDKNGYIEIV